MVKRPWAGDKLMAMNGRTLKIGVKLKLVRVEQHMPTGEIFDWVESELATQARSDAIGKQHPGWRPCRWPEVRVGEVREEKRTNRPSTPFF